MEKICWEWGQGGKVDQSRCSATELGMRLEGSRRRGVDISSAYVSLDGGTLGLAEMSAEVHDWSKAEVRGSG